MKYILFDIDGTLVKEYGIIPSLFRPDTLELVETLAKDYRIGIFSQGFRKMQLWKTKVIGAYKFVDPDFIYISLRKLGLIDKILAEIPKEDLIVIDNTPRICRGLEARGIKTILFSKNTDLLAELEKILPVSRLSDM